METRVVGKISDFKDLEPRIVEFDGKAIAVIKSGKKFFAYRDKCPHQGGPACEGDVRGSVIGTIGQRGYYKEEVSKTVFSIVCPWHSVEYELDTGSCKTDKRLRLRSYEVEVEGELVMIRI